MKFSLYNKFVFIGFVYVLLLAGFAVTWNIWLTKWSALLPGIAGALIIIGAVIFAYWLIDREKLARELKRKERTVSTLVIMRNLLLLWIYHYALSLSGHKGLYEDYLANRLGNRKLEDDINLLEYIFGVSNSEDDSNVTQEDHPDPRGTIANYTLNPKSVGGSLDYGLRNLEEIERHISRFPGFLKVDDIEIEKIMRLENQMRERAIELKRWEGRHGKGLGLKIDSSKPNLALRSNLKSVGADALEVMKKIDANLSKYAVESNR